LKYTEIERNIFLAWEDRSEYRCGKIFRIINPLSDICQISKGISSSKILLIGNSHADSIKKEFTKVSKEKNISVYFYVHNDPLISDKLNTNKILKDILKLNINSIVIHFSNLYDNQYYIKEIDNLILQAYNKNIDISIIAPTPEFSHDVPKEMYNIIQKDNGINLILNEFEHYNNIRSFFEFANQYKNKQIRIYDPAIILCKKNSLCLYADSTQKPLYFDSQHLTLTGSALLNPLFNKIINDILNNNKINEIVD